MKPQRSVAGTPGHRCDTCRTSFACETLNTALKVLNAHKEEIANPELKARYDAIVKALDAAGWSYPDGGNHCRFANLPREVQAQTAELVRIWQQSPFPAKNGDGQSVYQEEVRAE